MKNAQQKRIESLLPNGAPKYVRCYDNGGETLDRYTVVFTKRRMNVGCFPPPHHRGHFLSLYMSGDPAHGIGWHQATDWHVDRPSYRHLGKKVAYDSLPEECKKFVFSNYKDIWKLWNT